jgi:hypothetical protein
MACLTSEIRSASFLPPELSLADFSTASYASHSVSGVGCGVLWTLAYLLIIRQGYLDRTYGMPLAALCANLSWEFIFTFVYPHDLPQRAVNVVWLSFDFVILVQLLLYGACEAA